MVLTAGPWELMQLLAKVLMYAGMAGAGGGMFVLWLLAHRLADINGEHPGILTPTHPLMLQRRSLVGYIIIACGLGILAAIVFFLLQVGAINQSGLAGMFDPTYIRLFAASSIGTGIGYKLAGFTTTLIALTCLQGNGLKRLKISLMMAGILSLVLFAISFAELGHVAELGWIARLAIALHVAAVLLWTGALLPLYRLVGSGQTLLMQPLLRRFGVLAWGFVGCLLLAGIWLLWQLLEGKPMALFNSTYGWLMLGKLLLVTSLLFLAVLNKFRLVPALTVQSGCTLQKSIFFELVLAVLILFITAAFTTVTGPPHAI